MKKSSWTEKITHRLNTFSMRVGNQRHLQSVSDGMLFSLPFLVIGSFFLILANPPINLELYDPQTANWFVKMLAGWKHWADAHSAAITAPHDLTMGVVGVISTYGVAQSLAKRYQMNAGMMGVIASVVFALVSTPVVDGQISLEYLGTNGLFLGIALGLLVVEISRLVANTQFNISLPDSVPPMVVTFLSSLLPLLVNLLIFYSINLWVLSKTGKILPEAFMDLLTPATSLANSLGGFLLVVTIGNLLWLFGINGSSVIFPIIFTIGIAETGLNAEQFAAGETMTHLMNLQMFRIAILGGSGGTLGLVLLMMFSKLPEYRTIGRLSFIPGICSINEPIIFGAPIMFNPILAIPFLLNPLIALTLTYFAQKLGLIGLGYLIDPSFTPFFAQAFLSSFDWRNVVFTILLVLLSAAVYYPFFKASERQRLVEIND